MTKNMMKTLVIVAVAGLATSGCLQKDTTQTWYLDAEGQVNWVVIESDVRSDAQAAFDRLVAQVMGQEPYRSATRVFWVLDNGSAHRGATAQARLQARWPHLVPVHTPVHASWLNQIEIYFSIVQRKVLTPNEFGSLAQVEDRLLRFQERYVRRAKPFQWTFTRQDLAALLAKLQAEEAALPRAA